MSGTTVDELLGLLPEVNLRLRNLFQFKDGGWQANVCDHATEDAFQFGRGATATDALLAAIKAAGVKVDVA